MLILMLIMGWSGQMESPQYLEILLGNMRKQSLQSIIWCLLLKDYLEIQGIS